MVVEYCKCFLDVHCREKRTILKRELEQRSQRLLSHQYQRQKQTNVLWQLQVTATVQVIRRNQNLDVLGYKVYLLVTMTTDHEVFSF